MVQWLVTYESFDFGYWMQAFKSFKLEADAERFVKFHEVNKKNRNFKIQVVLSRQEYQDLITRCDRCIGRAF